VVVVGAVVGESVGFGAVVAVGMIGAVVAVGGMTTTVAIGLLGATVGAKVGAGVEAVPQAVKIKSKLALKDIFESKDFVMNFIAPTLTNLYL
jgi:hypothetical protein